MGSFIELNDTLQITKEQGFPSELIVEEHIKKPFSLKDFENRVFEFTDKKGIRIYQIPPVRNFLVENVNGKYIYWGLVHIVELKHDNIKNITSGKFKIIHINSPEEMRRAFESVDRREEYDYFERC